MSDNVTIAVIAACGVVVSALCILGAGVFAYLGANKRLEKIEVNLESIRRDMQEFYRLIFKLEAVVEKKD